MNLFCPVHANLRPTEPPAAPGPEGEHGDWREAEGAAPRRPGDDTSPEEAIRVIRGHEPVGAEGEQAPKDDIHNQRVGELDTIAGVEKAEPVMSFTRLNHGKGFTIEGTKSIHDLPPGGYVVYPAHTAPQSSERHDSFQYRMAILRESKGLRRALEEIAKAEDNRQGTSGKSAIIRLRDIAHKALAPELVQEPNDG